jgi:hypothetical protein
MRLTITRTTPVYAPLPRSGVFVQWDLEERPEVGPDYVFSVSRSEGPRGPFVEVAAGVTNPYYFDAHIAGTSGAMVAWEQRSISQTVYYRVQAFDVTTPLPRPVALAEDICEVGDRLPKASWLVRRKMQRDMTLQMKVRNGVPIAILKLKHWGTRCTRCFDRTTKSVLDNDCPICFATGFVGGYYDPIVVLGRKGVTAVQSQLRTTNTAEVNTPAFWMLDYPQIVREDILVELRTGRRFAVVGTTRTEIQGVPVHQRAEISELARDNTSYRVPVPTGTTPALGV